MVASRIAASGKIVTIAAGNDVRYSSVIFPSEIHMEKNYCREHQALGTLPAQEMESMSSQWEVWISEFFPISISTM